MSHVQQNGIWIASGLCFFGSRQYGTSGLCSIKSVLFVVFFLDAVEVESNCRDEKVYFLELTI